MKADFKRDDKLIENGFKFVKAFKNKKGGAFHIFKFAENEKLIIVSLKSRKIHISLFLPGLCKRCIKMI